MPIKEETALNLHTIKTKLHEHHFENVEGKYIARTVNERTLGVEDIVNDMKNWDNYPESKEMAMNAIRSYLRTRSFRLADGFAVSDEFSTIYPHISGSFNSPNDPIDPEKHRIVFRHVNNKKARDLAKEIDIEILEVAHPTGAIFYLEDNEESLPVNMYIVGNMVTVRGDKIKIAGDHPGNGLYFVPVDPTGPRAKMARIAENHGSKILGIAPDTQHAYNRIEIRTQYAGSGSKLLKEPRVITADFSMEVM